MPPTNAIGILNLADEIDACGEHGPVRRVEILDPETYDRAGREEGMKFVARTIELQDCAVGECEPNEVIGLPGYGDPHDIPKQRHGFSQPIASDSDETNL
jgi:hypothetical protein